MEVDWESGVKVLTDKQQRQTGCSENGRKEGTTQLSCGVEGSGGACEAPRVEEEDKWWKE